MLQRIFAALAMAVIVTACSTGGLIGGAAGAGGGYIVDGKRGAVIGGVGGAILGDTLAH